jgi:hypothetical protein
MSQLKPRLLSDNDAVAGTVIAAGVNKPSIEDFEDQSQVYSTSTRRQAKGRLVQRPFSSAHRSAGAILHAPELTDNTATAMDRCRRLKQEG